MPVTSLTKKHDTCPHNDSIPDTDSVADKARQQIDLEVQRLEDSIRALKSQRNVLASISRLPPEVLCKVFSYRVSECAGSSNPLEWVRVSHVSRYWRTVALDCPSLWGTPVFSRPKWCEEMLKRSKMASLIIKADLTCLTPKILDAVRVALQHGTRVHKLQLNGSSATIERLFSDTSFTAPMLRSLSLAVPRYTRFGTDDGVNIPEAALQGKMPYLRRVELTKCNLRWDSSLLQGLTYLKIHEISIAARPTTEQLVDALERMPALEVLDLQGALPRVMILPSLPPDRIINLPRLFSIVIKSSVPECVNLVNHITVPLTAHVHLSCSGTETTGDDLSGILKILSNHDNSNTGESEKRKIRVLHVLNDASQGLTIQAWKKKPDEKTTGLTMADIQLHLSWHSSSSPAVDVTIANICKQIQISHLRSLRLSHVPELDKEKWVEMFGMLPKLRNIQIVGNSAHSFLAALRKECPITTPLSSSPSGQATMTTRRPGLRRSKSRVPAVYFPGLKTLTLEDVCFDGFVSQPFEDLRDCLMDRCERKADIQELRILECSYLNEADVELLEELVTTVDWDGMEQGFSEDEDYDYGDEYSDDCYGLWGRGYGDSDSDLEYAYSF